MATPYTALGEALGWVAQRQTWLETQDASTESGVLDKDDFEDLLDEFETKLGAIGAALTDKKAKGPENTAEDLKKAIEALVEDYQNNHQDEGVFFDNLDAELRKI